MSNGIIFLKGEGFFVSEKINVNNVWLQVEILQRSFHHALLHENLVTGDINKQSTVEQQKLLCVCEHHAC